jgi:L-ascorbate metabolism protein UlaG (beta-lactamase superfamily)
MKLLKTLGKRPSGAELEKIRSSANFKNGSFKNLSPTEMMLKDTSYAEVTWQFINKPSNCFPPRPLPSAKTNLKNIQSKNPVIIWFGHSSYFIRINEKNILVDPVFCGHASPFSFTAKSFTGTDIYSVDDMPPIDVLVVTHDHYDHLDYETVVQLQQKTKFVCTSLGVASHLIYWGYNQSDIIEFDWWDTKTVTEGITITAAPARHFSGRTFSRNKTLWSSFILKTPQHNIYIGGDSGYDTHFANIGSAFGPFDIAFLECGQYNTAWPFIHMMPEQTAQAAVELNAKLFMPVHWGKFSLSLHSWNEPAQRVIAKARELHIPITTPIIGEQVILNESTPKTRWWLENEQATEIVSA